MVIKVSRKMMISTININDLYQGSLTLRYGDSNIVEGNVWDGRGADDTVGVRIFGAHHLVQDNWMSGLRKGALIIGAGDDKYPPDGGHSPSHNITLLSNTLENCKGDFIYSKILT